MNAIKLLGVDLPAKKAIWCSLSYINGIGYSSAKSICLKLNIDYNRKLNTLTNLEIDAVRKIVESEYMIEGDLKREIQRNIKRLIAIRCYRGSRHKLGLPVRGQRTKTNARTRKGRKSAPVAAKKIVKK